MHIQASAFPLIKPAHLLELSITAEGSLCVHANSTWARIPPEWSNSILIYSNLNLSKRADARVTSTQLVGGGERRITLSNTPFRPSWLGWHAVWRTGPCILLPPFLHLSLASGCSLKKPFSVFVRFSISVRTRWPLRECREWRRSPSLAQRSGWSAID